MRVETSIVLRTFCECGTEVHSADEWSLHRRRHFLDRCFADPELRKTMQWLRDAGFKDQPDAWRAHSAGESHGT